MKVKYTKDSRKLTPVNCTSRPWMPRTAWFTCSCRSVRRDKKSIEGKLPNLCVKTSRL